MTMPLDIFAQAEDPAGDTQSAAAEWTTALQDPRVRASMLSFGLQLMQPRAPGQSALGQVAQSIGNAAQTAGNIDELDRKDAEQARKERDTSSQIDYRAGMIDVKEQNANTAVERARIYGLEQESRNRQREAQAEINKAKVQKVLAEVQVLEMKARLAPQSEELKAQILAKKAELLQAQTDLVAGRGALIPSQIERNQTQSELNRAKTASEPIRAGAAQQRIDATTQRDYHTAKAEHDKNEAIKPRSQQRPFMSEEEWNAQKRRLGAQPSAAAPASPQKITVEPALPRDKTLWRENKIYPTPRGPARYLGNDEWELL